MSPDLEALIQLQQLDTTIAEARAKIASHPQRLAEADARLSDAERSVEEAAERLKNNQEARRALEKDASVFQSRLTKFKDQLSEVKTNREYQAMQHEIETAKTELGAAEEKVLERMVEADDLTVSLKQAQSERALQQKAIEAEKTTLGAELEAAEKTLERALGSRTTLVQKLDPKLTALFEQVARVRKGTALCTATRDGLCSVCHVRMRPPVFQQVRHNDSIVQCESCHRILYYVPPPPPVEAPVVHRS
jgi:uncharacterized protein